MKPYTELTHLGRIRRMRHLANSALIAYGLTGVQFRFLHQAGNTLFRVFASDPASDPLDDRYAPGQYMLRVHQPGYQSPEAIELELNWLATMSQTGGLPVPQPVQTQNGKYTICISAPGIPGERVCSLLRWVQGRECKRQEIKPDHYAALGMLMARLHQFSSQWKYPAGLPKRNYDWDGLYNTNNEDGSSSAAAWSLLPPGYASAFKIISQKTKMVMDALGQGPEMYGLIHADLGMEANVLFRKGIARIIDFDDSGFGYYLFDLAVVLEDSQADQIRPEFRAALLAGYNLIRPLPADQLQHLDLFLAAYAVYWSLWAADASRIYPQHKQELFERMERYFRLVQNFLDGSHRLDGCGEDLIKGIYNSVKNVQIYA